MDERTTRGLGALSALGAVLAVVAAAPSRWYGVPDTDAYVFDPPALTPLWVERAVMPVVAAAAAVLLVAGVAGLLLRDRHAAGRLRRWAGYASLAGLGPFALVLVVDAATEGTILTGAGTTAGALTVLVSLLVALAGLGLAVLALVALGAGYARTRRPVVGYALAAGPVASLAFFFLGGRFPALEMFGGLLPVVPPAAAFVVVGHELWTRTEPVPERAGAGGSGEAAGTDAE